MPKIPLKTIEVTQQEIKEEIAKIEELLKGRVDTSNINLNSTGSPELMSPYAIADYPTPKRMVNDCMKHMGSSSNFNIMWGKIKSKVENNVELAMLHQKATITIATESAEADAGKLNQSKEIEIKKPNNYKVMSESRLSKIFLDKPEIAGIMGKDLYYNMDIDDKTHDRPVVFIDTSIDNDLDSNDYFWGSSSTTALPSIMYKQIELPNIDIGINTHPDRISVSLNLNLSKENLEAEERYLFVSFQFHILCEVIR